MVPLVPNPLPFMVSNAPTGAELGRTLSMDGGGGVTAKEIPLLSTPATDTTMEPVVEYDAILAVTLVSLQEVGLTGEPFTLTALPICDVPKFVPTIVTVVPGPPVRGEMLVITGARVTLNASALLPSPFDVTTTLPLVAPAGTTADIAELVTFETEPATPLKVTVESAPKLLPKITIVPPAGAEVGCSLDKLGGKITVKLAELLSTPLACTVTPPVVAPVGTVVEMLVGLQAAILADTPLNCTVPWLEPKLLPEMVIGVPTCPDDGLTEATLGAGNTVNVTPLLVLPAPDVTTTGPVAAPDGTAHTMVVADQGQSEASMPLKVTFPVPCVDPKLLPLIVTEAPIAPELGDRLLMAGTTTVKSVPLLSTPLA